MFFNYEITRNFAAAWEALDRVLALQPDSWYYYSHQAHLQYFWKGDLSLVEKMLSRPRSGTGPEGFYTTGLYGCYKLLRRYDEAERVLLEDPQEEFNRNGLWPIPKSLMLGHVYEWKGDQARAQACSTKLRAAGDQPGRSRRDRLMPAGVWSRQNCMRDLGARRTPSGKPSVRQKLFLKRPTNPWALACKNSSLERISRSANLDFAIPILAHSLQIPAGIYRNELRIDPAFDQVRGDRVFRK